MKQFVLFGLILGTLVGGLFGYAYYEKQQAHEATPENLEMLINRERSKTGLKEMVRDEYLDHAANFITFSLRYDPDFLFETPEEKQAAADAAIAKEGRGDEKEPAIVSVIYTQSEDSVKITAEMLIDAWMQDPGSRKALLDPDYVHYGLETLQKKSLSGTASTNGIVYIFAKR